MRERAGPVSRAWQRRLEESAEMAEALYKPFWASTPAPRPPKALPQGPIGEILRYVPDAVALDLSTHQIAVLNEALARRRRQKRHAIDYRGAIPWFGRRFYFSFLAGPEGRQRQDQARKFSPRRMIIKVGSLMGLYLAVAAMAFPAILVLYFIKTLAGIDLFEGHSVLHNFIFW